MTEQELLHKLAALGEVDADTRKSITCALIGHSKIVTQVFGEVYCGRCGDKIGDTLMGTFSFGGYVLLEEDNGPIHNQCVGCLATYAALPWEAKFGVPDPTAAPTTPEVSA